MPDQDPPVPAPVQAVSLKLPTFWTQQARVWFTQAEAQFAVRNITASQTKFYHTVASLDQETAQRVVDLLENPPAGDPYKSLKDRLLETFALSEYERGQRLLGWPILGDDKPSVLMDRMLAFLDGHPPCFLFRALFLQRMPDSVRSTLVHSKVEDCRELAKAADALWSAHQHSTNTVSGYSTNTELDSSNNLMTGSFSRRGGQQKITSTAPVKLCWYHAKHGEKASRCLQPCSFSSSGNGRVDRQ